MIEQETALKEILRGVEEVLVMDELKAKLALNRPLRIKVGFDPTAPDLHLGHTVLLNKMKQFQDLGHEVVFLIGDFTGRIGDPTGKNITRQPLSDEQVAENAKTYAEQVFKILDKDKTQIVFNSKWLDKLGAAGLVQVAAQFNVARMLERDDFSKRYKSGESISIHEFLYPLLQGYDSVALESDIELGGTDQKFNLLVGRELQRNAKQSPQVVLTLPLLEGLDGVKKMSKSLNNYIGIDESPREMFGKVLSISDELMWRYYELVSFESSDAIAALKDKAVEGTNPKEIKVQLAKELITRFHNAEAAEQAEQAFIQQFQKNQIPEDIAEVTLYIPNDYPLANLIKDAGLTTSTSEANRMIKQGAVRIDSQKVEVGQQAYPLDKAFVLQVGKRRFAKVAVEKK
tara:strand:- start:419 stop:1621 length:1203 start_codon:yes stop_codon:yes gene_type:complete